MTELHRSSSIEAVLFLVVIVLLCEAGLGFDGLLVQVVVGVENTRFLCGVSPVEDFEHIPTIQFVISVEGHHDRVFGAVVQSCKIYVFQGLYPLRIFNVSIAGFVDLVKLKVSAVDLTAAVSRGVVDDDGLVVCVVLGEDGVETRLYSKVGIVVVARRDDADGQLCGDL